MARIIRILASGLTAGGIAVLGAAPASAAGPLPRAQLRSYICQPAVEPASRAISVTSVMRHVAGTQAFAVRFNLLSQRGGGRYTKVAGSDLGRWLSPADRSLGSRPGDVWILNKPVVALPAPATYRFRVSFRWLGRRHRVIATTTRVTAGCVQPELRPDLVIRRIGAPQPTRVGSIERYVVTIANRGRTTAHGFTVALAAPGSAAVTATVPELAPRSSTQVTLRGPACAASARPTVTVDLYDQVDDFDRANNVATASCAAATSPF